MSASLLTADGTHWTPVAELESRRHNDETGENVDVVAAYHGDGSRPQVLINTFPEMCSISIRLSPDTARAMAQALLKAADLVDAVKEELRNKLFPQEV